MATRIVFLVISALLSCVLAGPAPRASKRTELDRTIHRPEQPCPSPRIEGVAEGVENPVIPQGNKVIVSAPAVADMGYSWRVSDGAILEGQATPMVLIDTAQVSAGQVAVKLKLEGPPHCNGVEHEVSFRVAPITTAPPDATLIAGVVRDKTGNGLFGATVTARMNGNNFAKVAGTDEGGVYVLGGLKKGTYTVTARHSAFAPFTIEKVSLPDAGDQRRIVFDLIRQ
jgi:hypothetical protein